MTFVRTLGGPVVERPYYSALQLGAGIAYGGFAMASPGLAFLGSGAAALGNIIGGTPPGFFSGRFGEVSPYVDYLFYALGIGRKSPPPKPKEVPRGTDSANPAERGASYLRNYLGGDKSMPSRGDVINNLKNRGYLQNEADEDKWKRGDKALRVLAKDIIPQWLDDAAARTAFALKWPHAKTPAEKARVLMDPKGDHGYMKHITSFYPELQTENKSIDQVWEDVAGWFAKNTGVEVLDSMGNEAALFNSKKGIPPEQPLTEADKNQYLGELKKRGYTDPEAASILSALRTKPEADDLISSLTSQQDPNYKDQSAAFERQLTQLNTQLAGAGNEADKRKIQEEIAKMEASKRAAEDNARKRADLFLKDLSTSTAFRLRYGGLAYNSSQAPKDVPAAVEWVYQRFGRNVLIPPADPNADLTPPDSRRHEGSGPDRSGANQPPSDARPVKISDKPPVQKLDKPKKFPGNDSEYKFEIRGGGQSYYCTETSDHKADANNCVDSSGAKVRFDFDSTISPDPTPTVEPIKLGADLKIKKLPTPKKFDGNATEYVHELTSGGKTYYCAAGDAGKVNIGDCVDSTGKRVVLQPPDRPPPSPQGPRPKQVKLLASATQNTLDPPKKIDKVEYKYEIKNGSDSYYCAEKGGKLDPSSCVDADGKRVVFLAADKPEVPASSIFTPEEITALTTPIEQGGKGYDQGDLPILEKLAKIYRKEKLPNAQEFGDWYAAKKGLTPKDIGDLWEKYEKLAVTEAQPTMASFIAKINACAHIKAMEAGGYSKEDINFILNEQSYPIVLVPEKIDKFGVWYAKREGKTASFSSIPMGGPVKVVVAHIDGLEKD